MAHNISIMNARKNFNQLAERALKHGTEINIQTTPENVILISENDINWS